MRKLLGLAPDRNDPRKLILKYLRYAAIVLIVLAILAAVIHFYRESIARGIANSALQEQGITATELSIQTLGTDYIRLSYLVLEQDDGTRYEVSGLSFPLSFPSVKPETISASWAIAEYWGGSQSGIGRSAARPSPDTSLN